MMKTVLICVPVVGWVGVWPLSTVGVSDGDGSVG
jgi:hypothetical protein